MLRLSYLNSTQSPIKLTLLSNPYKNRVGLLPLSIALTFGWLFVIVWGAVSVFALSHSNYWADGFCRFDPGVFMRSGVHDCSTDIRCV